MHGIYKFSIPKSPMKLLTQPYYFKYEGITYKIPAGYAYDGLSIPRTFQWIVDMNDNDKEEAGLVHDFLYSDICNITITRKQADLKLFNDIKTLARYPIYIGVSLFGWLSWKKDKNYVKYKQLITRTRKNHKLTSLTK